MYQCRPKRARIQPRGEGGTENGRSQLPTLTLIPRYEWNAFAEAALQKVVSDDIYCRSNGYRHAADIAFHYEKLSAFPRA